jgi:hypothetical protein
LPPAREAPGHAAIVDTKALALPADHPALAAGDPIASAEHTGRAPRRLTVDQLRASLLAATGFTWVASRRVSDPESATGFTNLPDADMLDALAPTLGRADYATTTIESIDPAVTFTKLAGDAARSACRASVKADMSLPEGERRIARYADVRRNLAYLALRFWGRALDPNDAQLEPLRTLFGKSSTAGGGESDGWRAVCIAMATDPQFLTY